MTYLYPNLITYSEIDGNGLMGKFFEDLKNDNIIVKSESSKNVINRNNMDITNVALYVITFNSPRQFEVLIQTMMEYDKDFIDKEFLAKQKEAGVTRKLVAFELVEKGIPRHDYPIVDAHDNVIGKVTSGTMSPSLDKAIGLGYVPTELAAEGSEIFVQIRNKSLKAVVVKLPFYKG
jgi:glycine cleavage system aminomethyltransferase T